MLVVSKRQKTQNHHYIYRKTAIIKASKYFVTEIIKLK